MSTSLVSSTANWSEFDESEMSLLDAITSLEKVEEGKIIRDLPCSPFAAQKFNQSTNQRKQIQQKSKLSKIASLNADSTLDSIGAVKDFGQRNGEKSVNNATISLSSSQFSANLSKSVLSKQEEQEEMDSLIFDTVPKDENQHQSRLSQDIQQRIHQLIKTSSFVTANGNSKESLPLQSPQSPIFERPPLKPFIPVEQELTTVPYAPAAFPEEIIKPTISAPQSQWSSYNSLSHAGMPIISETLPAVNESIEYLDEQELAEKMEQESRLDEGEEDEQQGTRYTPAYDQFASMDLGQRPRQTSSIIDDSTSTITITQQSMDFGYGQKSKLSGIHRLGYAVPATANANAMNSIVSNEQPSRMLMNQISQDDNSTVFGYYANAGEELAPVEETRNNAQDTDVQVLNGDEERSLINSIQNILPDLTNPEIVNFVNNESMRLVSDGTTEPEKSFKEEVDNAENVSAGFGNLLSQMRDASRRVRELSLHQSQPQSPVSVASSKPPLPEPQQRRSRSVLSDQPSLKTPSPLAAFKRDKSQPLFAKSVNGRSRPSSVITSISLHNSRIQHEMQDLEMEQDVDENDKSQFDYRSMSRISQVSQVSSILKPSHLGPPDTSRLDEISMNLQEKETMLSMVQDELSDLVVEIKHKNVVLDDRESSLANREAALAKRERALKELEKALTTSKSHLTNREKALQVEKEELLQTMEIAQEQVRAAERENRRLRDSMKNAFAQIRQSKEIVMRLEEELDVKTGALNDAKKELKLVKSGNERLKSQLDESKSLTDKIDSLEKDKLELKNAMESRFKSKERELREKEREAKDLKEALVKCETRIQDLERERTEVAEARRKDASPKKKPVATSQPAMQLNAVTEETTKQVNALYTIVEYLLRVNQIYTSPQDAVFDMLQGQGVCDQSFMTVDHVRDLMDHAENLKLSYSERLTRGIIDIIPALLSDEPTCNAIASKESWLGFILKSMNEDQMMDHQMIRTIAVLLYKKCFVSLSQTESSLHPQITAKPTLLLSKQSAGSRTLIYLIILMGIASHVEIAEVVLDGLIAEFGLEESCDHAKAAFLRYYGPSIVHPLMRKLDKGAIASLSSSVLLSLCGEGLYSSLFLRQCCCTDFLDSCRVVLDTNEISMLDNVCVMLQKVSRVNPDLLASASSVVNRLKSLLQECLLESGGNREREREFMALNIRSILKNVSHNNKSELN